MGCVGEPAHTQTHGEEQGTKQTGTGAVRHCWYVTMPLTDPKRKREEEEEKFIQSKRSIGN